MLTADMFSGGGHGQVGRQILRQHFLGGGHHGQPAADVFQLADVAGPRQLHQQCFGIRMQAFRFCSQLFCGFLQKMACQTRNVPRPFPQRRQLHADHIQAVEQVFTEFTFRHQPLQILMGGGNNPHIHLYRRITADAVKLAFCQHTQQPGLNIERHITDFIEKQRAAVRLLKTPLPHL